MKYTIKFQSNKDCTLTIDSGAPINLQARGISKGQLTEGFYLFAFSQGDDTISVEYPHIKPEFEDMIRVDWDKKEIVSCILPALAASNYNPDHRKIIKDESGQYFLIDVESEWKKELPYKYVTQFRSDGYAQVYLNCGRASNGGIGPRGDVGLINKAGEIVVPLCYSSISEVSNGYMFAIEERFWTTILDENGIILFTRHAHLGSRQNGVNPTVCKDGLIRTYETYEQKCGLGYINLQNEIVISPMYEKIERCGYNLFKVQLAGKYGLVDKSEQILIPFEYGGMIPFQIGPQKDWNFVFIVRHNSYHDSEEKYRIINCQNIPLLDNKQFDSYKIYSNGIWLKIESLWLFYDKNLSFITEYPDEQIIFGDVVCIKEGEQIKPIPFSYPQAIKYRTQCIDNE